MISLGVSARRQQSCACAGRYMHHPRGAVPAGWRGAAWRQEAAGRFGECESEQILVYIWRNITASSPNSDFVGSILKFGKLHNEGGELQRNTERRKVEKLAEVWGELGGASLRYITSELSIGATKSQGLSYTERLWIFLSKNRVIGEIFKLFLCQYFFYFE